MNVPRVLHTIARMEEKDGGPARTVTGLCAALAEREVAVEVVTGDTGVPGPGWLPDAVTVYEVQSINCGGRRFPRPGALRSLLRERIDDEASVVVHDHGIWLPNNHVVARLTRGRGVPRIVSPRGMLSDWALRHRGWKKRIAWGLYQRRDLDTADVLHATSDAEADEIFTAGIRCPVAVIPNGVRVPEANGGRTNAGGNRRALFLSRIHPKKGLENLVEAWAGLAPPEWELVVAGPGDARYVERVEKAADDRGIDAMFLGPVADEDKWDLYRSADLFVLPTHSENFGIVVAEALACGVPVITTRQAPWSVLEEERCGWWIEDAVDSLAGALAHAVSLDDEERWAMGDRGRRLVEDRFSWAPIAREMARVYEWMIGRGDRPDCVRVP